MSQSLPLQPQLQAGGWCRAAALRDAPAGRTGKGFDEPHRSAARCDCTGSRLRRPESFDLRLSPRDRRNSRSFSRRADLILTDNFNPTNQPRKNRTSKPQGLAITACQKGVTGVGSRSIPKGVGLMRYLAWPLALVAGLLLSVGVGQAQSTGTVTATCKDGTTFTGAKRSGACRGHGGVQSWGTAAASGGLTNPATEPAANSASTKGAAQAQSTGTVTATCKDGTAFTGAKRS